MIKIKKKTVHLALPFSLIFLLLSLSLNIYAADITEAFARCGKAEGAIGQTINIGTGSSTRFNEMVSSVVAIVGKGDVEYVPWPRNYEKIETGDVRTDISKLCKITNWKPEYTLKKGIEETYKYYI